MEDGREKKRKEKIEALPLVKSLKTEPAKKRRWVGMRVKTGEGFPAPFIVWNMGRTKLLTLPANRQMTILE